MKMKENYIVTFFSHFGAVRFSRELKKQGFHGQMMPVPRNLSSSCGTCVLFQCDLDLVEIRQIFQNLWTNTEEVEQVVRQVEDGYESLFRAEDS